MHFMIQCCFPADDQCAQKTVPLESTAATLSESQATKVTSIDVDDQSIATAQESDNSLIRTGQGAGSDLPIPVIAGVTTGVVLLIMIVVAVLVIVRRNK